MWQLCAWMYSVYGASFSRFVRWLVSRAHKTHSHACVRVCRASINWAFTDTPSLGIRYELKQQVFLIYIWLLFMPSYRPPMYKNLHWFSGSPSALGLSLSAWVHRLHGCLITLPVWALVYVLWYTYSQLCVTTESSVLSKVSTLTSHYLTFIAEAVV